MSADITKSIWGRLGRSTVLGSTTAHESAQNTGCKGRSTVLGSTTAHESAQSTGAKGKANQVLPAKQYCLSRLAVVGLLVRFWCDCHNSKP